MTRGWLVLFVGILLVASLSDPAGSQASTKNVTANVTLNFSIAISASNDLNSGIAFTNLSPGTSANNASKNVNSSEGNNTTYHIKGDNTNSVNLDLCVNASGNLTTSGGDFILLPGNYTWNDSRYNTTGFATYPGVNFTLFPGTKANTTTILPGERVYFRFFLKVPDSQPAGSYANTLSFRAKVAGVACT